MKRNLYIFHDLLSNIYGYKVFKSAPNNIFGRQPLKNVNVYGLLKLRGFSWYFIAFACNARSFAITIPFSSFQTLLLDVLTKVICEFFSIGALSTCDQDWTYEYDIPFPLEINNNGGFYTQHVKFCFWTTKKIIAPLP